MQAIKLAAGVTPTCWRVNPIFNSSFDVRHLISPLLASFRRRRWSYSRNCEWTWTPNDALAIRFPRLAGRRYPWRYLGGRRSWIPTHDWRCEKGHVQHSASCFFSFHCIFGLKCLLERDYNALPRVGRLYNDRSDEVVSQTEGELRRTCPFLPCVFLRWCISYSGLGKQYIVPVGVAYNITRPYVEDNVIQPNFIQCLFSYLRLSQSEVADLLIQFRHFWNGFDSPS